MLESICDVMHFNFGLVCHHLKKESQVCVSQK